MVRALMVAAVLVVGGCNAAPEERDGNPVGGPGAGTNDEGGMDGAGSIGIGMRWDRQVFLQQLWEGDHAKFLVHNQGDDEVDLGFFEFLCDSEACRTGASLNAPWHVAADSTSTFDADGLVATEPVESLFAVRINGEDVGLVGPPWRPRSPAVFSVVSNMNINTGSYFEWTTMPQMETDFVTAPGMAFTVTVTFSAGGVFWAVSQSEPVESLEFLNVLAARSARAEVSASADGFRVQIPDDATELAPVRVELDVEFPSTFAGGPVIGLDAGVFCLASNPEQTRNCDQGINVTRAFAVAR